MATLQSTYKSSVITLISYLIVTRQNIVIYSLGAGQFDIVSGNVIH